MDAVQTWTLYKHGRCTNMDAVQMRHFFKSALFIAASNIFQCSSATFPVHNAGSERGCPVTLQSNHSNYCYCNPMLAEIRCNNLDVIPTFTDNSKTLTWNSIDMQRQRILAVEKNAFSDLLVRRILLNFNTIGDGLKPGAFSGLERVLRELYLGGCRIQTLPVDFIHGYSELRYLHLWGNQIAVIPAGFFYGAHRLCELMLWNNHIDEICEETFRGLRRLKRLDLYGNRISTLDKNAFGHLTELEVLNLGRNNIHALYAGTFSQLFNLKSLNIDRNQLKYVYSDAFFRLESLLSLSLRDNAVSFLFDDVFKNLRHLVSLRLDGNALENAWAKTFDGLESLRCISLARNRFGILPEGVFRQSPRLDQLFLDGNFLRTIHQCIVPSVSQLRVLSFMDNPIQCDCRFRWVRDMKTNGGMTAWGMCYSTISLADVDAQVMANNITSSDNDMDVHCSHDDMLC